MTPIPASYDELQREVMDLRKRCEAMEENAATDLETLSALTRRIERRLDKLEREAEAKARTAHYPPVRPLREPNYRTLGNRLDQDDDGA
jgi:cob(I)alamin adenosyltransferase